MVSSFRYALVVISFICLITRRDVVIISLRELTLDRVLFFIFQRTIVEIVYFYLLPEVVEVSR